MRRFRYALDPACLIACAIYALDRWGLHGHLSRAVWPGHFRDAFLVPAALPLLLWVEDKLGLRLQPGGMPTWSEVLLHLAVWSFAAEALLPRFDHHVTGDWVDVAAYALGAALAFAWWHRPALRRAHS